MRTPGSAFHALMATYAVIAFNPDDHMTAESRVAAMRRTGQALSALGRYHAEMSKEIYGNLPPRLAADIGGKPEELLTEAGRVMEQLTTAYEAHVEDARREMNRLYGPDVVQAAAANGAGRR